MPKYVYYCEGCDKVFEIKHSLQKTCTVCEICGAEGALERRPSAIFLTKKDSQFTAESHAGATVKKAIEETRQDLKQDQENLKGRTYKK